MQSAEYMSTAFIENLYSTGTIFTQIPWLPPQLSTQAAFVQFPQATGKQLSGCTEVYNAERRRQNPFHGHKVQCGTMQKYRIVAQTQNLNSKIRIHN